MIPELDPGCILADLCSVTTLPLKQMIKVFAGSVASAHSLFSPMIPDGFEPLVTVCQSQDEATAQAILLHSRRARSGPSRYLGPQLHYHGGHTW